MSPLHDSLIRAPLFRGVPTGALEAFVAASRYRDIAVGEYLLRSGQSNDYLYLILSGSVTVHIGSAEGVEIHLGAGECVGELSLIDRTRASATVIARELTTVLAAHRNELWALIDASPEVARNLLSILAGRLRHDDALLLETVRLQMRYEHESTVDAVTGVRNRRWLDRAFEELLEARRPGDADVSLLMIDLDHFKVLNDTHGHAVGDAVLRRTAQTLAGALRPTDLIARYGGEEFAALLPDTASNEAFAVAERLRHAVEGVHVDVAVPPLSVSIGVATAKPPAALSALLSAADAALYRAKQAGRNCVRG